MDDDFAGRVREWDDKYLHEKFWEGEFWLNKHREHKLFSIMEGKMEVIREELKRRWDEVRHKDDRATD